MTSALDFKLLRIKVVVHNELSQRFWSENEVVNQPDRVGKVVKTSGRMVRAFTVNFVNDEFLNLVVIRLVQVHDNFPP